MAERPAIFEQIKKDDELCVRDTFDRAYASVSLYVIVELSREQIKKPWIAEASVGARFVSFLQDSLDHTPTVYHRAPPDQQQYPPTVS